jgi:hypothetical protein
MKPQACKYNEHLSREVTAAKLLHPREALKRLEARRCPLIEAAYVIRTAYGITHGETFDLFNRLGYL